MVNWIGGGHLICKSQNLPIYDILFDSTIFFWTDCFAEFIEYMYTLMVLLPSISCARILLNEIWNYCIFEILFLLCYLVANS